MAGGDHDQRIASHGPCTIAFPNIARAELDMFIDTQVSEDDPVERLHIGINQRVYLMQNSTALAPEAQYWPR